MTHVHAEVAKNIKNVVAKINNFAIIETIIERTR